MRRSHQPASGQRPNHDADKRSSNLSADVVERNCSGRSPNLKKLNAGEPVELPIYDFRTHTRLPATTKIEPKAIVIVEGILIFAEPRLLEQMDIKVFVDTPDDVRFIRRLQRDIAERGRTLDSVIEQYLATVRPMHMQFVEPSKRFADVIIPEGGYNLVSIDLISGTIRESLANSLHSVGGQS